MDQGLALASQMYNATALYAYVIAQPKYGEVEHKDYPYRRCVLQDQDLQEDDSLARLPPWRGNVMTMKRRLRGQISAILQLIKTSSKRAIFITLYTDS